MLPGVGKDLEVGVYVTSFSSFCSVSVTQISWTVGLLHSLSTLVIRDTFVVTVTLTSDMLGMSDDLMTDNHVFQSFEKW